MTDSWQRLLRDGARRDLPIVILKYRDDRIPPFAGAERVVTASLAGGPGEPWARWALLVVAANRAVPPSRRILADVDNYQVLIDAAHALDLRRCLEDFGFEVYE